MLTPTDLRNGITGITVLAGRALESAVWSKVGTPDEARDALMDVLPPLVTAHSLAAAAFTADWYDELRLGHGAKGRFTAIPADQTDQGTDELARWGVSPLFRNEPDWSAARVLVLGGMQRRIANASRYTVTASSAADPAATGWRWTGVGGCDYCRDLISSGAVHSSADFASHDHCRCAAVPSF